VLLAAAIAMVLLAAPMALFGQETAGRNMEEFGTETPGLLSSTAPVSGTAMAAQPGIAPAVQ
jgi:hypothetical protein